MDGANYIEMTKHNKNVIYSTVWWLLFGENGRGKTKKASRYS